MSTFLLKTLCHPAFAAINTFWSNGFHLVWEVVLIFSNEKKQFHLTIVLFCPYNPTMNKDPASRRCLAYP